MAACVKKGGSKRPLGVLARNTGRRRCHYFGGRKVCKRGGDNQPHDMKDKDEEIGRGFLLEWLLWRIQGRFLQI